MSKKYFIALADAIRNTKPHEGDASQAWWQWAETRDAIADVCQSQDFSFNRKLWLDYIAGKCGPNGGAA